MSLETSHSYSSNHGGNESCGHRYQDTIQYTSSNLWSRGHRSSFASHSYSCNYGGCVDRGVYMSQDTSHSYSINWGTIFDVEGRDVYIYQTGHYSSRNQDKRGRLLDFSVDTVDGDGNM